MAQYPQGIFQSLQYLLKRVKILALQKQPTYSGISTASAAYIIPGRGMYEITTSSATNSVTFPDPTFYNGQTIIITNTDTTSQVVSATNAPYIRGSGSQITGLITGIFIFVSVGGKWRGGILS